MFPHFPTFSRMLEWIPRLGDLRESRHAEARRCRSLPTRNVDTMRSGTGCFVVADRCIETPVYLLRMWAAALMRRALKDLPGINFVNTGTWLRYSSKGLQCVVGMQYARVWASFAHYLDVCLEAHVLKMGLRFLSQKSGSRREVLSIYLYWRQNAEMTSRYLHKCPQIYTKCCLQYLDSLDFTYTVDMFFHFFLTTTHDTACDITESACCDDAWNGWGASPAINTWMEAWTKEEESQLLEIWQILTKASPDIPKSEKWVREHLAGRTVGCELGWVHSRWATHSDMLITYRHLSINLFWLIGLCTSNYSRSWELMKIGTLSTVVRPEDVAQFQAKDAAKADSQVWHLEAVEGGDHEGTPPHNKWGSKVK